MTSESIGPYRVLSRRLDGDVERVVAEAPGGPRVVLRRRGSGGARRLHVAEAVAFARADHPHVATLVDVLTGASGDLVLAFEDVGGDPLVSWLAARGRPEPGEVITLVVPVLGAVQHLARRGVAVCALEVDDIEIDARGAPVLVGVRPGAAGPDAEVASLPVAAAFARAMVERAARPTSQSAAPTLDATSFESLAESVFDLGEAVPLSSVERVGEGLDHELVEDGRGAEIEDERLVPGWLMLLPESETLDRLIARVPDLRPKQVLAALRAVRGRYRLLAGAVVVVVGAAVALGPASTSVDDASSGVTASDGTETSRPVGPVERPSGVGAPSGDPTDVRVADDVEALVLGDDPGAAAETLLAARLDCLRDATPSCLDAVDQPGSPIALRDALVLNDPSRAGAEAIVLELSGDASRTGGTVLLSATSPDGEPASVLVMRTEAGWRLRDVFVDP